MTRRDLALTIPGVLLGVGAGAVAALNPRLGIMGAALVVGAAAGVVLLMRRTIDRLVGLMLIALPLQSTLVLDLGITLRLTYLFAGLALLLALANGRVRHIRHPAMYWLGGFLLVVVFSIAFTPFAPAASFTASGLRGIFGLRPLIQCAQLALMVGCMYLTYMYIRTRERLDLASSLILAGGLFSLAYGLYAFVTLLTGLPYIEINNAMNTDFGYGYKEQGNSYAGGYIPRPRSTFMEPLNFGNFLILVMGLTVLKIRRAAAQRARVRWAAWGTVALVAVALFVIGVNSRGAIAGTIAASVLLIAFVRHPRDVWRSAAAILPWTALLLVLASVFVQLRYKGGIPMFLEYFSGRITGALSAQNRVQIDWDMMRPVVADNPLFGVGFGNMPFYWPGLEGRALQGVSEAGSLYLRLLGDVGVIGLALWLAFVAAVLMSLLRAGRAATTSGDIRAYCVALFFIIAADAVQRIALVGIATDAHMWVEFALALGVVRLAHLERQHSEAPA